MVELEEISFGELKPLVELGFGNDPALLLEFQQIKTELPETIKRNLDNIENAQSEFEFTYYKVKLNDTPIGFTVIDKEAGLLWSFGIDTKWRKKEVVMQWFEKVKEALDGFVTCMLWNQNLRAIRFLEKQGMKIIGKTKDAVTLMTD